MIEKLPELARGCFQKKAYSTEDVARGVAIQCWKDRGIWLRVYACEVCAQFHLTKADAPPMMKEGWRLPKKSRRQIANDRKREKFRRK